MAKPGATSVRALTTDNTNHELNANTSKVPDTILSNILSLYPVTPLADRPRLLSTSRLKNEYLKAAQDGDSSVPVDAEEEVDFHYTCFVKANGHLLELDGDLSGPIDLGALKHDEDVPSEAALVPIRRYMRENGGGGIGFSMLALASRDESNVSHG